MKRWIICLCLFCVTAVMAAETTSGAQPTVETTAAPNEVVPTDTPVTSAVQPTETTASSDTPENTTSAASAAEPTESDPEYTTQAEAWQKHPDARQFGQEWVLVHKSEQSYQQGIAIILPEWQQTASLLPLSKALSRQGFDCVILLPTPAQIKINPGDEKQQEAVQQQLELWSNRLSGVDENMPASGGHRLLIAQGSSAVWLGQLLAADKLNKPDALVLLNAFYPDQQANNLQATQLSNSIYPVLDLYQENRSNWLIQTAQQRQLATKRSAKLNMRQQTIYDLSEAPEKISGWLTTLGWK